MKKEGSISQYADYMKKMGLMKYIERLAFNRKIENIFLTFS